MSRQNRDLSQYALWFVEDTELSQDRPSVVVDFFAGQTVIGVECVHPAKRTLDPPPRRRKTTPAAEVGAANHDFNEYRVVRHMPALHFDFKIRQSLHELLIKLADSVRPFVVVAPRLVVIARGIAEGAENAFQIMRVLKSNVLLNQCDPSRRSIFRKRCACHNSPSVPDITIGVGEPPPKWLTKN
jgi:hypothetical protein